MDGAGTSPNTAIIFGRIYGVFLHVNCVSFGAAGDRFVCSVRSNTGSAIGGAPIQVDNVLAALDVSGVGGCLATTGFIPLNIQANALPISIVRDVLTGASTWVGHAIIYFE